MPGKFKLQDKHIAFANAIAGGMQQQDAYIKFIATRPNISKGTAATNASGLMRRKEVQEVINRAKAAREAEITGVAVRNIPKEFTTPVLTTDELDAYHSSIILGIVEVEELIQVYNWVETYDKKGKLVGRTRQAQVMKVPRRPNVREKQISIDALFKRFGSYAPSRFFGALKNLNNDGDIEENVERFVLLSNGEKIPLLTDAKATGT